MRNARLTRGLRRLRRRAKAQMEQPPVLREPIDPFTFPPAPLPTPPPDLDFDEIRVFIETGWDEVSTKDDDLEPLRSRGASRTSRRSHLLVAGFEGTCVICLKPINIGDRIAIAYRKDSFAIARRRGSPLKVEGWRHHGCPQRASRGVPSRAFRRINERLRGRRRNRGEGDD